MQCFGKKKKKKEEPEEDKDLNTEEPSKNSDEPAAAAVVVVCSFSSPPPSRSALTHPCQKGAPLAHSNAQDGPAKGQGKDRQLQERGIQANFEEPFSFFVFAVHQWCMDVEACSNAFFCDIENGH